MIQQKNRRYWQIQGSLEATNITQTTFQFFRMIAQLPNDAPSIFDQLKAVTVEPRVVTRKNRKRKREETMQNSNGIFGQERQRTTLPQSSACIVNALKLN